MKVLPRLTEDEEFFIIKHGVRWTAMPAWGNIMADSEIGQVVKFLSHSATCRHRFNKSCTDRKESNDSDPHSWLEGPATDTR